MKNITLIFLTFLSLSACKQSTKIQTAEIQFETMGTFGTVKIVSDTLEINHEVIAADMDSILIDVNMGLSTYIWNSVISLYNGAEVDSLIFPNKLAFFHFDEVAEVGGQIMRETKGSFNPFIKPLVDYYAVQNKAVLAEIDSFKVDSILECMYYDVNYVTGQRKEDCASLDASAIAKGYGVDVIAEYLSNLGYTNYMVEIGGEVVCRGVNATGDIWRLGIEEPIEGVRSIYEIVALKDKAMATSGNYRNFKILENGQKVVHIINPKTGYPEISNLLSASIIAEDCMSADAYATACMVMGVDTCFDFVFNKPELECYLIYSDEAGELQVKFTDGFGEMLVE